MPQKVTHLSVFSQAKLLTAGCIAFSLCLTAADVGMRRYSGRLVDAVLAGTVGEFPWAVPAVLAVLLIGLNFLLPYSQTRLQNKIQAGLCSRLEEKALCGEQGSLHHIALGEASTLFTSDVAGIVRYVSRMVSAGVPDLFTFVLSNVVLCAINPWMSGAAIAASLLPVLFMFFMSKGLVRIGEKYQGVVEKINQNIANHFYNLEMIKANTLEETADWENAGLLKSLLGVKRRQSGWEAALSFPTMFSSFLTLLFLSVLGGYFVLKGSMQLGQLFTAIALADYIVTPVMRFDSTISQIRRARVSFDRLNKFLSTPDEGEAMDCLRVINGGQRLSLEVSGLEFAYGSGKRVFSGADFRWEQGKLHAIVGENGAGKSTLLKLLSGVYLPQGGELTLRLPGSELPKKLTRQELREQLIIDCQKTLLFPGTIRYNLTGGREIPLEAVKAACRTAGIAQEIEALPEGYGTLLGPDGSPLSGGQKRRLCLARTMLRQGRVFLLDEPTAGIDPARIRDLVQTLRAMARDRLIIVITHEPMLIQAAGTVTRLEVSR